MQQIPSLNLTELKYDSNLQHKSVMKIIRRDQTKRIKTFCGNRRWCSNHALFWNLNQKKKKKKNIATAIFLIIIRVHFCKGQQPLPSPKCNEAFFDFIKYEHLCEPSSIWNICCKFHLLLKSADCSLET